VLLECLVYCQIRLINLYVSFVSWCLCGYLSSYEEERLKSGYYERTNERRRNSDVGDNRYALLQLSLPGLRV